jgi:Kef-type K+ transport system membrane component KefB
VTLSTPDLARLLLALSLLLAAAHVCGHVFARLRMPRVIGEIVGGLLLGPTFFGALLPRLQESVFAPDGATAGVLGAVYQLGLLLLMFCSGAEIRASARPTERRVVLLLTLFGTVLPLAAGLLVLGVVDFSRLWGPAGNATSFLLVFAIAIAVTSIPVISRILHDLGLMETSFAAIVLAAAVIEDVLLYVALAVAVGLVQSSQGEAFGVAAALETQLGPQWRVVYYVLASFTIVGVILRLGPSLFRRVLKWRFNLLNRSNAIAFQLVVLLVVTGGCILLGVTPMFGALVAGTMVVSTPKQDQAREAIQSFSFAFFIPIYFAMVGLRLDLIRDFSPWFFLVFFVFACAVKSISVYSGARLAGEKHNAATNFAVAMNARGGPGIVLASVAYDALIINESFYSALVMLAILTSLLAGAWLDRVVRSGRPLRDEDAAGRIESAKENPAVRLRSFS